MQALQTEDAVTQRKSHTDNAQKREPLFTLIHSLCRLLHLLLPLPETGFACRVEQLSMWHKVSTSSPAFHQNH